MGFSTSPKDGPAVLAPPTATTSTQTQKEARQRAIDILTRGQQVAPKQDLPVQNATQISPEELSAIKSSSSDKVEEKEQQKNMNETAEVAQSQESKSDADTTKDTETEEQKALSTQYAQMARKEKAIRAKQQEILQREEALKAREAALQSKDSEYQQKYVPKDRLTQDTLSVLNELGISYDQLTEMVLSRTVDGQNPSVESRELQEMKAEIKRLNEALERNQKAQEENQQKAYQQALNNIRNEAKKLVDIDDSFEAIKATDSIGDVVELIERTFKEDGVLLTVEEACREVESYLEEETLKLTRLKKIQAKLQQNQSKADDKKEVKQESQQQQQAKTLTNNISTTRRLTAKERAILAFEGKLKQ